MEILLIIVLIPLALLFLPFWLRLLGWALGVCIVIAVLPVVLLSYVFGGKE